MFGNLTQLNIEMTPNSECREKAIKKKKKKHTWADRRGWVNYLSDIGLQAFQSIQPEDKPHLQGAESPAQWNLPVLWGGWYGEGSI